ncbi:hypothetical protein Esti_001233 [Eimeria stiedai]
MSPRPSTPGGPAEGPEAGRLLLGENGRLLLRDAELLAAYMQAADAAAKRRALACMSWGSGAELLPSLRRLLLSPQRDRQIVSDTVDALLPPSTAGPLQAQDPELPLCVRLR